MRSYIGAYKALSRCIPKYSSLMSPLEDAIKGKEGCHRILWHDDLLAHFKQSQDALRSPTTLVVPTPSDQLIMTVDASPLNNGISATLFVVRDGSRLIADLFSMKLKEHQRGWQPCELEGLAITTGVRHFAPYIRESQHALQILSDSKPCVQAYHKLCHGQFSASSRVSTFLSCLSEHNVTVTHLKGDSNKSSDYGSRHPQICNDDTCQICTFVNEAVDSTVSSVSVADIASGKARMPFLNPSAWKAAQQDCPDLRRTYAHLTQGTRPSRKARNLKDIRRYLNVASLDNTGLIVVKKQDPYAAVRYQIVVPRNIIPGIATALHLHFEHATKNQLIQLFKRYFYGISSDTVIHDIVDNCTHCNALKSMPVDIIQQTSTPSPTSVGEQFAADVIRRQYQKILTIRDIHSSFTVASIIPDEKACSLRDHLIKEIQMIRAPSCVIRVDNAPGFVSLVNDELLLQNGIHLELGQVKNPNKNPVAEKCNQELELELLRLDPSGKPVSYSSLQKVVRTLNTRIRNRGLSAREILFCRDQNTGQHLSVNDAALSAEQAELRERNHLPSAHSKGKKDSLPHDPPLRAGDLVYLKSEGSKFQGRHQYLVTHISESDATLQKMLGSTFSSRRYTVPISQLFRTSPRTRLPPHVGRPPLDSDSDSDTDSADVTHDPSHYFPEHCDNSGRPVRTRREPAWLRSGEWKR